MTDHHAVLVQQFLNVTGAAKCPHASKRLLSAVLLKTGAALPKKLGGKQG